MGIKIEMRLLIYIGPIAPITDFSRLQKDEKLPKFQIYFSWISVYSDVDDLMSLNGFQRNSVFGN